MGTATLLFMGEDIEETFRGRIYGAAPSPIEERRAAFVDALATTGVLDAPAYDDWIAALQGRGWVDAKPRLEPIGDGSGRKYGRWKLNDRGRAEWAAMKARTG